MQMMVFVHGDQDSEPGAPPSQEFIEKMLAYQEELVKAGIQLEARGLQPLSKSKRVRFANGKATVVDGPFTESKEMIAGFSIWKVKSLDEALAWVKRAPFQDGVVTIRPMFGEEDFDEGTPELRERDRALRAEMERQKTP